MLLYEERILQRVAFGSRMSLLLLLLFVSCCTTYKTARTHQYCGYRKRNNT